jgi:hypothetical protein
MSWWPNQKRCMTLLEAQEWMGGVLSSQPQDALPRDAAGAHSDLI